MITTRQIREKAAELIEERGWAQETLWTEDGRLCLLGAILMAGKLLGDADLRCASSYSVVSELCNELGVVGLGAWNDAPKRKVEEVLAALRGKS